MDVYVATDAPAIALVDDIISKAVHLRASDVHIEPTSTYLRIRIRVDGLLHDSSTIGSDYARQVISRIKVLSHMDISERRIPQDGKFIFSYEKHAIDVRVATFPSIYGEKVVLRILDRSTTALALEELGFDAMLLETIQKLSQRATGFFLVTGPTGSGKTTTLHAMLAAARTTSKNIVSLEDPIEYTIEGITQAQIYPAIGFTFEHGIRALLRQDPDIIMVGEIRDKQTAHVALQAAITGHLVLSTLHTNDATSSVVRLLDMGIEPFLLNAAVTGVLSQRLVRKLCNECKYLTPLSDVESTFIQEYKIPLVSSYISRGCTSCRGIGYKGRIGLFELLVMSHELRALIMQRPSFDTLYKQACTEGMRPLLLDAADKIDTGSTSVVEVMRVLM